MDNFDDSVSNIFTIDGNTPKGTASFIIFHSPISNVPTANSTNNTNFLTGILWDGDDDENNDGEFSSNDEEDLVFVTKINPNSQGAYGIYDYEMRVPAKLREYDNTDSNKVVFYVELR